MWRLVGRSGNMRSDLLAEVVAAVAAVAAAIGLGYARSSAHAARDALAAARRTMEVVEMSRQGAERARVRHRVERVGELVQEILISLSFDSRVDGLSPGTQGRCNALSQAVVGLKDLLPRSADVCLASSPIEMQERAVKARAEVDRVLVRLARSRSGARYPRASGARWSGHNGQRRPRRASSPTHRRGGYL